MPLKIMHRIFVTLLFLFCFTPLVCQATIFSSNMPVTGTTSLTPFDQRFISLMKRWRIPGASVTIIRNGQIILAHGYGWSDAQSRQPVSPNSLFRIGSVSKAVTAVTVLKLVQEGKVRLDDKAFMLLNDLSPLNNRHNPAIYQITIRNLLQMASGWETSTIDPMFGPWSMPMLNQLNDYNNQLPPSCETAARLMMGIPLRYRPGTQYSYSNINYCLLGLITNKASGNPYGWQTYQNFVQQTILAPIGIYDMHIGDTLPQNRALNEVKYYTYPGFTSPDEEASPDLVSELARIDGLPYSNSQILKKNYADGGWLASSMDLAKFLQGISNHQILSSSMLNLMLGKPTYSSYTRSRRNKNNNTNYFAMGCSVKRINNQLYWYKTGSFTGTYALIMQGPNNTSYAAVFNIKPSQRINFLAQLQRILISGA